jgi:hypothetical protein
MYDDMSMVDAIHAASDDFPDQRIFVDLDGNIWVEGDLLREVKPGEQIPDDTVLKIVEEE